MKGKRHNEEQTIRILKIASVGKVIGHFMSFLFV